ncbi:MAG: hypothetical protein ACK46X_13040 [Candidatus Sericytochromatia bacterium]
MQRQLILTCLLALASGAQMLGCAGSVPISSGPGTEPGAGLEHLPNLSISAKGHKPHKKLDKGPVAPPRIESRPLKDVKLPKKARKFKVAQAAPESGIVAPTAPELEGRVLVISADGQEACLPAIREALDYIGVPYTVWTASQQPGGLTADKLCSGNRSFYQGVILATSNLAYFDGSGWRSALSEPEWQTLWSYEAAYKVRQVSWYSLPTPDDGYGALSATGSPTQTSLTAAGQQVFPYLNAGTGVEVKDVWTYLAPSDATVTPLLTDAAGHTLAGIKTYDDGRQNLGVNFDGNQHLIHSITLGYGLVNWVTSGLFMGERRVYIGAQSDDYLIADDIWGGGTYRMSDKDLQAYLKWQTAMRATPMMADFRLDWAFNGEGTVDESYAPDTLTPLSVKKKTQFKWISHTYSHMNLNAPTTYTDTMNELNSNHAVAQQMGLGVYDKKNLVTPEISGLSNPEAMRAMFDFGVRYLVSNTSIPDQDNPRPNVGLYHPLQPSILMIPRHPNNLFYNVSTPDEWTSEYNHIYRSHWGRDLAYTEVLDKESDMLVRCTPPASSKAISSALDASASTKAFRNSMGGAVSSA